MRIGVAVGVFAPLVSAGCGSTEAKPAPPPKVTTFTLQSKVMGRFYAKACAA